MYTADYFVLSSTFFIRREICCRSIDPGCPAAIGERAGPCELARAGVKSCIRREARVFRPPAPRGRAGHLDFGPAIC